MCTIICMLIIFFLAISLSFLFCSFGIFRLWSIQHASITRVTVIINILSIDKLCLYLNSENTFLYFDYVTILCGLCGSFQTVCINLVLVVNDLPIYLLVIYFSRYILLSVLILHKLSMKYFLYQTVFKDFAWLLEKISNFGKILFCFRSY